MFQNKTTTPLPITFDLDSPVSLEIPDQLYGSSFTLVTNASKIISNVIYVSLKKKTENFFLLHRLFVNYLGGWFSFFQNTADRAQEFAERINSGLRHKFGYSKKFIQIGDHNGKS